LLDEAQLSSLAGGLHPLEKTVLSLFTGQSAMTEDALLAKSDALQPAQLSMALGWLQTKAVLKVVQEEKTDFVSLTEVGQRYARDQNPPLRMAEAIKAEGGISIRDLRQRDDMTPEEKSRAIGALKASGAVKVAAGGILQVADASKLSEFDQLQQAIQGLSGLEAPVPLQSLSPEDQATITQYHRKRSKSKGIFRIDARISRRFAPTENFAALCKLISTEGGEDALSELSPEALKDGTWRGKRFRKYNIQLQPSRISGGIKHPYKAYLDQVKQQFVAMGFEEMRGPLVESEFWDMDALFMPQFHPARAIHDVYFVKNAPPDQSLPKHLVDRVADAHKGGGGTGSRGWRYPFDPERTRRLILRSQGTAVSARTLGGARLGQAPKLPGKYFSIARCFRYDQVDATHAPDFFQVEGIVLGEEIHFRTLLGLLTLFAKEVAQAREIKFLPAYFPFTEPSVEMHVRHPKLGWMELGGAGLFRPEVTGPLGVDVPVIAWGLGLDRMAMVALEISDIRNLFSSDLGLIRKKQQIHNPA